MLQTLKACFTALFEHHRDAFMLYDCDGRITTQNDAAVRLRRISPWDEVLLGPLPRAGLRRGLRRRAQCIRINTLPSSEGDLRIRTDLAPVIIG